MGRGQPPRGWHVKPGMSNAKMCLEQNRDKPGFSPECKSKFEEMMARRATDFRLDEKLRELCRDDIEEVRDWRDLGEEPCVSSG